MHHMWLRICVDARLEESILGFFLYLYQLFENDVKVMVQVPAKTERERDYVFISM